MKPVVYFSGVLMLALTDSIPPMSSAAIDKVQHMTDVMLKVPQIDIETAHVIHAGMYARTIMIPAGVTLTGALIKIATMLIVSGKALVFRGDKTIEIDGYNVLAASSNRKQAFYAVTDTWMTMIFPSNAADVAEAEAEFTDEVELLLSHQNRNCILITGER
jgi:hypothetical protein